MIHGKALRLLKPRDEATGYSIFVYLPEEQGLHCNSRSEIICAGKLPLFSPGIPLELEVEWKHDCFYHVAASRICTSRKAYSLFFLDKIKGISADTANRILEGLDNDIRKLLELDDPEGYLAKIPGAKRFAGPLLEQLGYISATEGLFFELSSLGIEFIQIDQLVKVYRADARECLKQDTYDVCSCIGIPFLQADYLARYFEKGRMDVDRMRAIVWELVRRYEEAGHTRIRIKDMITEFYRLLKRSPWPWVISPVYLFCIMQGMPEIRIDGIWIARNKRFQQEKEIAKNLSRICSASQVRDISENDIEAMEADLDIRFLDSQKELFRAMGKNKLILLTGGPGTGKTTDIKGAIRLCLMADPKARIGLCAPTARAAQAMKAASGHPASTIHSMVGITPHSACEGHQELPYDLLIVDEMSMVDTEIFYHLLRSVKTGCQVILCGDPDQLESVGCGAVFRDLLECGKYFTVKLWQIMRQEEESGIVENCRRIKQGRTDLVVDQTCRIYRCGTEEEAVQLLLPMYDKNTDWSKQQILSTTKTGMLGIVSLNRRFEMAEDGQECYRYRGFDYKRGDKVVFVVNNYKAGYCNGDIGKIEDIQADGGGGPFRGETDLSFRKRHGRYHAGHHYDDP